MTFCAQDVCKTTIFYADKMVERVSREQVRIRSNNEEESCKNSFLKIIFKFYFKLGYNFHLIENSRNLAFSFQNFSSEQQREVPRVQVAVPRHQQHRPCPPVHSTLRCGEHIISASHPLVYSILVHQCNISIYVQY